MLSAFSEPEAPSLLRRWHGVVFGFLLLLIVSVLGIGAWYWWSHRQSVTQTSSPSNSNPELTAENSSTAPSQSTSATTPQQTTSTSTADEEIKQLREKRITAKPSERVDIISALEQVEKKYPNDYRFPYELSKLSIKGITSHDEAFDALARAAQKAIDNGQAEEMLNRLMADKYGDLHKLSHGHREWEAMERALRNKDKGVLTVSAH
jgi:Na+-transporting methylmalonyl-CoA/oxaloacetate decarboxylase gamma subunit